MANSDTPRGLKPYGRLYHVGIYVAGATIFPGDVVKFETGAANVTQKRARVIASTAAAACCGVALNYATVGQSVRVADDPAQLFVGQCDDAGIASNADLGMNAAILATAGDTTYKCSRMEIDASTKATTATLELKVIGIMDRQDGKNEFGNAFVEVIVKINNHQLGSGTGTLAI